MPQAGGRPAPAEPMRPGPGARTFPRRHRLDLVRGKALHFGVGIEGRFPDGAGRGARTSPADLRLTGALRW